MARLEHVFHDTSKTLDRVSKARRTAATAVHDLGEQVLVYALAEPYQPLASGFEKLSHVLKTDADLLASQVSAERAGGRRWKRESQSADPSPFDRA